MNKVRFFAYLIYIRTDGSSRALSVEWRNCQTYWKDFYSRVTASHHCV